MSGLARSPTKQPGPTVRQVVLASTEQALSFARQEQAHLVVD